MDRHKIEEVARAICAERCAHYGDPPCWHIAPEEFAKTDCGDPDAGINEAGCRVLATAALRALAKREEG